MLTLQNHRLLSPHEPSGGDLPRDYVVEALRERARLKIDALVKCDIFTQEDAQRWRDRINGESDRRAIGEIGDLFRDQLIWARRHHGDKSSSHLSREEVAKLEPGDHGRLVRELQREGESSLPPHPEPTPSPKPTPFPEPPKPAPTPKDNPAPKDEPAPEPAPNPSPGPSPGPSPDPESDGFAKGESIQVGGFSLWFREGRCFAEWEDPSYSSTGSVEVEIGGISAEIYQELKGANWESVTSENALSSSPVALLFKHATTITVSRLSLANYWYDEQPVRLEAESVTLSGVDLRNAKLEIIADNASISGLRSRSSELTLRIKTGTIRASHLDERTVLRGDLGSTEFDEQTVMKCFAYDADLRFVQWGTQSSSRFKKLYGGLITSEARIAGPMLEISRRCGRWRYNYRASHSGLSTKERDARRDEAKSDRDERDRSRNDRSRYVPTRFPVNRTAVAMVLVGGATFLGGYLLGGWMAERGSEKGEQASADQESSGTDPGKEPGEGIVTEGENPTENEGELSPQLDSVEADASERDRDQAATPRADEAPGQDRRLNPVGEDEELQAPPPEEREVVSGEELENPFPIPVESGPTVEEHTSPREGVEAAIGALPDDNVPPPEIRREERQEPTTEDPLAPVEEYEGVPFDRLVPPRLREDIRQFDEDREPAPMSRDRGAAGDSDVTRFVPQDILDAMPQRMFERPTIEGSSGRSTPVDRFITSGQVLAVQSMTLGGGASAIGEDVDVTRLVTLDGRAGLATFAASTREGDNTVALAKTDTKSKN